MLFAIASTNPSPSVFVEMRKVPTLSSKATRSTMIGMRRATLDQRSARAIRRRPRLEPAGSVLGDLARAAGHDILVAFAAALRVVGRSESVGDRFDLFEDEAVVVERPQRDDVVLID